MSRRRIVGGWSTVVVVAVGATLVVFSGESAPQPVSSPARTVKLAALSAVAAPALPTDCIPSTSAPPYEFGTLVQIGHPAGYDQSIADGTLTAGPVAVTGISASVCGIVKVVPGTNGCVAQQQITIPADGQHFGALEAVLSVNPAEPAKVPFHVIPHAITADLGCTSSVDGLAVSSVAALGGSTGLFGIGCIIGPAQASLTGTFNSPTDSFGDFEGTLSGSIALPTATVAHACPSEIASNLNLLAGLPRTGQVTLPTRVALYQAGSAP